MTAWLEECAHLAPLESFDPAAFRGDDRVPQHVCNLVLTLALVYNDCKDVLYWHTTLIDSQPPKPFRRTRAWGATAGIADHQFRVMTGLVHELFQLIRKEDQTREHPFFASVVKKIPPSAREAWHALVAVADGGSPPGSIGRILQRLRDKVSFHYEAKAIVSGYSRHFSRPENDRAYLSRGESMRESRFYFADAAAQAYSREFLEAEETPQGPMLEVIQILQRLNIAIFAIVDAFIQRRGCAYRTAREETD